MAFQKANKADARLRLALCGPAGSGKTYSALAIAKALGGKVALVDTERGSAAKYADLFDFDVLCLDSFEPAAYVAAIRDAEAGGYSTIIIDSLSHAWNGRNGALEQADQQGERSGNKFTAWAKITPQCNALTDSLIGANCHVIATMRVKTEWEIVENEKGKKAPKKMGLKPIQRDGMEYEFDVVLEMADAAACVSKTRCPELSDETKIWKHPGADFAAVLLRWLRGSGPAQTSTASMPTSTAAPAPATAPTPAAPLKPQTAEMAKSYQEVEAEFTAIIAPYLGERIDLYLSGYPTNSAKKWLGQPGEPQTASDLPFDRKSRIVAHRESFVASIEAWLRDNPAIGQDGKT